MKKNHFFLLFCMFLLAKSTAQTQVDLIMRAGTERFDSVVFFNLGQNVVYQTVPFSDSIRFEFDGKSDDIYDIKYLGGAENIRMQLWLGKDGAKVVFSCSGGKLQLDTIIGSKVHYDCLEFSKKVKLYQGAMPDSVESFMLNQIIEHFDSPVSMVFAENYVLMFRDSIEKIGHLKAMLETQPEVVKHHFFRENLMLNFSTILEASPNDSIDYRDFTFFCEDSTMNQIKPKTDGITVLDFWYTHCSPCLSDHQRIKKDFANKEWRSDVRLIGISMNDDFGPWKHYLVQKGIVWENFLEYSEGNKRLSTHLKTTAYPTYIILDKANKILRRCYSYHEVKQFIKNL